MCFSNFNFSLTSVTLIMPYLRLSISGQHTMEYGQIR